MPKSSSKLTLLSHSSLPSMSSGKSTPGSNTRRTGHSLCAARILTSIPVCVRASSLSLGREFQRSSAGRA
jgi:hypothetical protein